MIQSTRNTISKIDTFVNSNICYNILGITFLLNFFTDPDVLMFDNIGFIAILCNFEVFVLYRKLNEDFCMWRNILIITGLCLGGFLITVLFLNVNFQQNRLLI